MRIGVLSDTHDHVQNLQGALAIFRREGIGTLMHCGEVSTPDTAVFLREFRVVCVFGNTALAQMQLGAVIRSLYADNYAGISYSGELGGVPIRVTHGHLMLELERLIADGRYQYVFHGHTHTQGDEQIGRTPVINPGALGGKYETPSVCIVDLETGEVRFIEL